MTESDKIIQSYRIVYFCCIGFIIFVIFMCAMETSKVRSENRLLNTKYETLYMDYRKLKNAHEQLQDWRIFMRKSNPQEIRERLKADKLKRFRFNNNLIMQK